MPDRGAELGVDLYWLSTVANDDLPSVANVFTDASTNLSSAGASVDALMRRPSAFGGGTSPIFEGWHGLHATTLRFLNDTVDSLEDTSRALNLAIDHYTDTDTEAKRAFDEKTAQLGAATPAPVK
ncbi:hypothetical protein BJ973_000472 [Actinoplanes tereljensis]|uniref:Uncharacterized protein n=1 Tax=Paractinoplanes tereljensis TaxID=571912 RepID=A0A919NTB8_9ACTN|nr:hypothetical protein [Actinoplanes tereljensis]GIF23172.1 hypothetical protein Ate02nite_59020 [Actinoplanes tereljensis]